MVSWHIHILSHIEAHRWQAFPVLPLTSVAHTGLLTPCEPIRFASRRPPFSIKSQFRQAWPWRMPSTARAFRQLNPVLNIFSIEGTVTLRYLSSKLPGRQSAMIKTHLANTEDGSGYLQVSVTHFHGWLVPQRYSICRGGGSLGTSLPTSTSPLLCMVCALTPVFAALSRPTWSRLH